MKLPGFSLRPVARIAFGLVSLLLSLLICLDFVFNLLPDRFEHIRQSRQQVSEYLASQTASVLQTGDAMALHRTLRDALLRHRDLRAIAVRPANGDELVSAGDYNTHWHPPEDGSSTLDQIRVPILSGGVTWGEIQLAFRPALPETLLEWLLYPSVVALGIIAVTSYAAFYLYLRRVLEYLDPTKAIPDRVRTAFDTLGEGVLVLDKDSRVVLANKVFRGVHPDAGDSMI